MRKEELHRSLTFGFSFLGLLLLFREFGLFWEHTPEDLHKIIGTSIVVMPLWYWYQRWIHKRKKE
jgi:hypothetical protein